MNIEKAATIPLSLNVEINVGFGTYTRKSYVRYNKGSIIKFEKNCVINRGQVRDVLSRVPKDITEAFRYIDPYTFSDKILTTSSMNTDEK